MKIIKKFIYSNKITGIVSRIFDDAVKEIAPFLKFNTITLELKNDFNSKMADNSATVYLDYTNDFIQNTDEKAIRFFILREFFKIFVKKKNGINIPEFVEELIVNREMVKNGYANEVSYFYYAILARKPKIKSKEDFLYINLPWLIFYEKDEFYCSFFKKLSTKLVKKYNNPYAAKVLNTLKKNLWDRKNLENAARVCGDFYANN